MPWEAKRGEAFHLHCWRTTLDTGSNPLRVATTSNFKGVITVGSVLIVQFSNGFRPLIEWINAIRTKTKTFPIAVKVGSVVVKIYKEVKRSGT